MWGFTRLRSPARRAATRTTRKTAIRDSGLSGRGLGKRYGPRGGRWRQYSRRVAKSRGLNMTYRSLSPLPARTRISIRWLSMSVGNQRAQLAHPQARPVDDHQHRAVLRPTHRIDQPLDLGWAQDLWQPLAVPPRERDAPHHDRAVQRHPIEKVDRRHVHPLRRAAHPLLANKMIEKRTDLVLAERRR